MNTYEVIEATREGHRRFQTVVDGAIWEVFSWKNGILCIYDKGSPNEKQEFLKTSPFIMSRVWKEITPIVWHEAILKNYLEGETVLFERGDRTVKFKPHKAITIHNYMIDGTGKWYLERE